MSGGDPTTHIHITEREADGSWEDCTWMSGLEFYRDAIDPTKPATHTEGQALRAASGEPPTGGSNLGDFRRGVAARYHATLPPAINAHSILTALKPGYVGTVQGSMSAFGPLNPLSKWDRNFDGSHDVWVARRPDGVLLWCDPEAPTTADVPVIISEANLQKFVNAFGGEAIVAPALKWPLTPGKDPTVEPIVTYLPGYTAQIKPQSNVRNAPHIVATKLYTVDSTADPVVLIGTVLGDVDPANGKNVWYCWWDAGRKSYAYTATDNIINLAKPSGADDGYTKATQDAAVAAQSLTDKAAVDAAEAAAAKSAAEAASAPAIERDRIATAEANRIKAI